MTQPGGTTPMHRRGEAPAPIVSIKTVAAHAGVSAATVSNALNGKPTVSPALVARVRAAVEALGYAGDNHASRLRSGKRALAGVLVPDLSNPMFGAFVSTLERCARGDGFDLLVVSSANDPLEEAARLRAIRAWRPAGLIVIPCDGALRSRLPHGIDGPVVVADRIPDDAAFDLIAVDNFEAAGAIAAHLAGTGSRSCLVAGSSLAISNVHERWDGVRAGAGAMTTTMLECGLDPGPIRERLLARLARAPLPDALFTLDHLTTLVAYRALAERRLRVGQDIAVASFDDTEWMGLVDPPLTVVRQPVQAMAEAAWRQFARRLAGDAAPFETTRLACAIEIRGSTPRTSGRPETAAA